MSSSTKILSDRKCQLGEGPAYDPATGTLYWFDIVEKKLLEKRMPDGDVIEHDLPVMASALAVIDDSRQLLVTERGLEIRDKASGKLTLHKEIEADNPLTRSNDSRVHPSGAFWIGTMAKVEEGPAAGAIYWYKAGELRTLYSPIAIPNSICFSADGATAYFVDSAKNKLMRVACDPNDRAADRRAAALCRLYAAPAASTARCAISTASCGTRIGARPASTPMRPMAS